MAKPIVRNLWVNLLGFQLCWWLCALGANTGAAAALALLVLHLALHPQRAYELKIMLACAASGLLLDTTLVAIGVLVFPGTSGLLPFWLVVLWAAFAATLNQSLSFLRTRLWLTSLLGAIGGASSYWAGAMLGRLSFGSSTLVAVIILAVAWSLLLPLLMLCVNFITEPSGSHPGHTQR